MTKIFSPQGGVHTPAVFASQRAASHIQTPPYAICASEVAPRPYTISGHAPEVDCNGVELGNEASGVLYALGGASGGVTLYLDKGQRTDEYNMLAIERTTAKGDGTNRSGQAQNQG